MKRAASSQPSGCAAMRARTSAQRAAIAASPSTRANARASGSPRTGASSRTPQPLAATRCALSN
ncbi:hypothetical protein DP49_6318 [Burkholderia pseudomallei]|nr:hypothetical protein DP49_6318 [Burkholderia pseudomallei]